MPIYNLLDELPNHPMDDLLRRLRHLPDLGWSPAAGATMPSLAVWDEGGAIVIEAELPGLTQDDIELTLHQDILTLTAERAPQTPDGFREHRRERPTLQLTRSIHLPVEVDPERTSAELSDGVLTIRLERALEAKPRKISIR